MRFPSRHPLYSLSDNRIVNNYVDNSVNNFGDLSGDTLGTVWSRNLTDSCMICVRNMLMLCVILIPSKIEQETDSHA